MLITEDQLIFIDQSHDAVSCFSDLIMAKYQADGSGHPALNDRHSDGHDNPEQLAGCCQG
jgi:hypothetical protein